MQTLQAFIPLMFTLSLSGLLLSVGLHATRDDLFYVLKRPRLLRRASLAVLVLPAIVAGAVAFVLPLAPIAQAAILLMAISPVAPLIPGKELELGGRKEYAYGLYIAMALLSIVFVPVCFAVASAVLGRHDAISMMTIAKSALLAVIAPLTLGLLIRRLNPPFAEQAWSHVYRVSMILLMLVFVPMVIVVLPEMAELVSNGALLGIATVSLVSLVIGHVLGGPDEVDRTTLATAASVRHPGIATLVAATAFGEPRIAAALLMYLLCGNVVALSYQQWLRHRNLSHPKHA